MTDNIIIEYKIYNLQKDYNKYSDILYNYQSHIERCYKNYIITITERNTYLKIINDLIKEMNTTYNFYILETYNETESDTTSNNSFKNGLKEILSNKNINNIEILNNLININNLLNKSITKSTFKQPYDNIKTDILNKLASKIGFYNIHNGLILLIGDQYENIFDDNIRNLINIYNKLYVPLNYSYDDNITNNKLYFKKIVINNDILFDNCAELYILFNDKYIKLSGYFNYDTLNIYIRTSQICNNLLYKKKKNIENLLTKSNIDEKFLKSYIRNSNLSEFIVLSEEEYIKQINMDYEMFIRLRKLSFMNLMKEFIKEDKDNNININHMYKIIKLLLLGNEDTINIAGLLYGISKEKKMSQDNPISEIIYKNLNYLSQIKLKTSSINIKSELEKIKTISNEDIDLKKQIILSKNMPNYVKKSCLEKIEEMKTSNNEYYKQLLYVKTLLNFPFPSIDDDTFFIDIGKDQLKSKEFLESVVNKLNNKVYGHNECKETIKEEIAKWISNPSSSGNALGLVGPPGVGKTLIAKALGKALDIPFVQITLGGQNDGELLHGHGYTYSGSQPGMIIKKMVEAGSARCIIYFDELDKACKKHDNNEIYNILIHMIDPNTNKEFTDRFFQEIKFPLNKVLFIFSYNDSKLVDNILMDRIKELEVKPFKLQDKIIIFKEYLLKEMSDLVNFEYESIQFTDEDIEFIIDQYTYEPGVRELKRKIEKIFLKLNVDKIYKINLFENITNFNKQNPLIMTRQIIEDFLGKHNSNIQYIHTSHQVGVVNGLYATDLGKGGVLPIQIYNNYTGSDDKFTLKLTGSQKRVMRESVVSAFTCALNILNEEIRNKFIENNPYGFHIHTPSGAIPKDGPSAGSAFATAFVSRILDKKIKNNVAMTGEIELTGKVSKIGGLQYKLTGAKKAGVKLVLVSKENYDDIEKIKSEYKDLFTDGFEVKLVDNIIDILENSLIDFDLSVVKSFSS